MKFTRFEDIVAWQKSKTLSVKVYKIFGSIRDYSFRDQIFRAVVSIMNNIAEGYERQGNKEFRNFLYIAKGSCAEVRSMLLLAYELRYVSPTELNELLPLIEEIARLLSGLIKSL